MSEDSADKMNSLSLSDESKRSIEEDAPCLILCYGSGIGITLVWRDCSAFHCNHSSWSRKERKGCRV